jgi:hypothetical protein
MGMDQLFLIESDYPPVAMARDRQRKKWKQSIRLGIDQARSHVKTAIE